MTINYYCVHYNNGEYMKKIYIVIIVVALVYVVNVKSRSYDYLLDSDCYDLYTLSFENLNTKNILKYFSNINIIRIYPRVNSIYKERIGNISYEINSDNLHYEIDLFKEKYLSLIKKNSYLDYNYLYMNCIPIDRLDVYISGSDLNNLISSEDLIIKIIK